MTERILRQTSLARIRYGILRMPVEFWAATEGAKVADKASNLLWQPIRNLIRKRRKIEKRNTVC